MLLKSWIGCRKIWKCELKWMISHVSVHDLADRVRWVQTYTKQANSRAIKGSRLYAGGRLMVPLHAKTVNTENTSVRLCLIKLDQGWSSLLSHLVEVSFFLLGRLKLILCFVLSGTSSVCFCLESFMFRLQARQTPPFSRAADTPGLGWTTLDHR